jgi:hypothetical protein
VGWWRGFSKIDLIFSQFKYRELMELNEIQNINDLKTYVEESPGFTPSQEDSETLKLKGKFGVNISNGVIQWAIAGNELNQSLRYKNISNGLKIMLFKKKRIPQDNIYTAGILFPLDFERVIKSIVFNGNTAEVEVFKNALYWTYDRNTKVAFSQPFSMYKKNENFIISGVSTQMDSQSPSHPNTGIVDPGIG